MPDSIAPAPATPITYVPAPSLSQVKAGGAVLQKGHKGEAVSYAQELLRIHVDSKFGNDTEKAVLAFHQQQNITTDPGYEGKIGKSSLDAMETVAGSMPAPAFDYNKRNKLKDVHVALKERIQRTAQALAARQMDFLITDGFRTFEEQIEIYKQGRKLVGGQWVPIDPIHKTGIRTYSWGGKSNHNYGLAVDSYPVISGQVFTAIPSQASLEFRNRFKAIQQAIGEEGERAGLLWGGRWNHPYDPPHLQLFPQNEMTPSTCLSIYQANDNSLAAVWDEVDRRLA